MKRFIAFVLLFVMGATSAYAASQGEQGKIQSLLASLETPGITFVRNGESHDGAWARKHLEEKLTEMGDKVKTADDFITKVGTGSSHSGKPYEIKTSDGKTVAAADWFKSHLSDLNKAK